MEPRWLTLQMVRSIHTQVIGVFGGSAGVRDAGLLDSALERPRNLFHYAESPSLFELAAAYCAGIVKNQVVSRIFRTFDQATAPLVEVCSA
jgi:death-on-curing protein